MGSQFSLCNAEIKTLYFVFNSFADDLFKLISNKFRVVCKVDRNLQLDSRDSSMYSSILKDTDECDKTAKGIKNNVIKKDINPISIGEGGGGGFHLLTSKWLRTPKRNKALP